VRAFGGGRSSTTILTLVQNLEMLRQKTALIKREGTTGEFNKRWLQQTLTAEYQFARLHANIEKTKIQLGTTLLPTAVNATRGISNWIEQADNQVRLQHAIKQSMTEALHAAHAFGHGIQQVAGVMHDFDTVLGGSGHTLKLLLELFLLKKAAGFATRLNTGFLNPIRALTGVAKDATVAVGGLEAAQIAATDRPFIVSTGGSALAERAAGIAPWREADAQRAANAEEHAGDVAAANQSEATAVEQAKQREQAARVKAMKLDLDELKLSKALAKARGETAQTQAAEVVAAAEQQAEGVAAAAQAEADAVTAAAEQVAAAQKLIAPPVAQATPAGVRPSGGPKRGVMNLPGPAQVMYIGGGKTSKNPFAGGFEHWLGDDGRYYRPDLEGRNALPRAGVKHDPGRASRLKLTSPAEVERESVALSASAGISLSDARERIHRAMREQETRTNIATSGAGGVGSGGVHGETTLEKSTGVPAIRFKGGRPYRQQTDGSYKLISVAEYERFRRPGLAFTRPYATPPTQPVGPRPHYLRGSEMAAREGIVELGGMPPEIAQRARLLVEKSGFSARAGELAERAAAKAAKAEAAAATLREAAETEARTAVKASDAAKVARGKKKDYLEDAEARGAKVLPQRTNDPRLRALNPVLNAADLEKEAAAARKSARESAALAQSAERQALARRQLADAISVEAQRMEAAQAPMREEVQVRSMLQKAQQEGIALQSTATEKFVAGKKQEGLALTKLREARARASEYTQIRSQPLAELVETEKTAAYAAGESKNSYDALTQSYSRNSGAVKRLLTDNERLALTQKEVAKAGPQPAFARGGEGFYLGAPGSGREPGRIRTGLGKVGGYLGGANPQSAVGVGLLATMFGDQIGRALPGTAADAGASHTIMGAGMGAMFAPMIMPGSKYAGLYGAAIGASFGLSSAIGGAKGSRRAKAGSILGNVGEGAALGATIGSVAPIPGGPLGGAAIGAAAGLGIALFKLGHHADETGQKLIDLAEGAKNAKVSLKNAQDERFASRVNIANDTVARDQAKTALETARKEEVAARGTDVHTEAVNRLRAAEINHDATVKQVREDEHALAQAGRDVAKAHEESREKTHQYVAQLVQVARQASAARPVLVGTARAATQHWPTAAERAQTYADKMEKIASQARKTNPQLARTAQALANVARQTDKIPTDPKYIRVILRLGYDPKALAKTQHDIQAMLASIGVTATASGSPVEFALGGVQGAWARAAASPKKGPRAQAHWDAKRQLWVSASGKAIPQAAAFDTFAKLHPGSGPIMPWNGAKIPMPPPPMTFQGGDGKPPRPDYVSPTDAKGFQHLELLIEKAQYKGDTPEQRRLLGLERQWLMAMLANARNDSQRSEIWQRLNQLKSQGASLDSASVRNGGLGIIPGRLQDAANEAKRSGNKSREITALVAEQQWLKKYLADPKRTPLEHRKAEKLLTSITQEIQRLHKTVGGKGGSLIPLKDQMRIQTALHGLGGSPTVLKKRRDFLNEFLGEPGHTGAERHAAARERDDLNRKIKALKSGDGGYGAVYAAYNAAKQDLEKIIHNPKRTLVDRTKAQKEENTIDKAIATLEKKQFGSAGGGAAFLHGKDAATWITLQNKAALARQTPRTTKDDIAALRAEDKFLRRVRESLHGKDELAANKLLASIDTKLGKLVKAQNDLLGKLEKQFLDEQRSFYSQFASNDFHVGPSGKRIENLNVNFPHPPTGDGHREAIITRRAMEAAFE
jgi:hypothetical protein